MKLKKLIEQSNQNADFTTNYEKNKALKKKLFILGGALAIIGFVVALTSFIIMAVFGSDLKSISSHTVLLVSMLVLLILFSVVFGTGLYVLRTASFLHLTKPDKQTEIKIESN